MLTQHVGAMSSSLIAERTTKSIDRARSPARRRVVGTETPATPDRLGIIGLPA
jgi:hypothetical protein